MGSLYDIPAEFDDVKVYNSTLGHKVNNQFGSVANSKFWPLEHPRFGKSKRGLCFQIIHRFIHVCHRKVPLVVKGC